ncbi:recombinase family protein [Kitasatospora camelliae]|uniref:Recombinase family protein n=1 Tax=Kitasatospora camelliae TaxID=3156397 RepID=A0AAU8JNP7_9ACTN
MATTPYAPASLPPAAYLRWLRPEEAARHGQREALRRFAARLGVPAPVFYEDHTSPGADATRCPPAFEALVHAVMGGSHRLLLIPGPWVFSGGEARVRLAVRVLTAAGCGRILMLPAPGGPARLRRMREGARPARAPR